MNETEKFSIRINLRDKKSISEQVQKEIRSLINTGRLSPGSQLPTVRELAAQIRVNFNTVARAYRVLDAEGLISTQQGRGTFVNEGTIDRKDSHTASQQNKEETIRRLTLQMLHESERLGITEKELIDKILHQTEFQSTYQAIKTRPKKRVQRKKQKHHPLPKYGWLHNQTETRKTKKRISYSFHKRR